MRLWAVPETNSMSLSTLSDETLKYRHPRYTGSPFRSEVTVQGNGRWCKTKQKPFHVTSPMFALLGCKIACSGRHARKIRLGERPCHPIITLFNSIKKKISCGHHHIAISNSIIKIFGVSTTQINPIPSSSSSSSSSSEQQCHRSGAFATTTTMSSRFMSSS